MNNDQWEHDFEAALARHLYAFAAAWRPDMKSTSAAGQAVEALDDPGGGADGGAWLYLYGPSGSGKTIAGLSAIWRGRDNAFNEETDVLGAEGAAFAVGERHRLLTAAALSTAVAEARTGEAREALLEGLASADVVLMDGLGTCPLTEAALCFMGELLDRKRLGRLVLTSPLDPDGLLRRLRSTPAAHGLVRRIREKFTGIQFEEGKS